MIKFLYLVAGFLFLALGAIGVFIPVLPTTPFLLVAAFCLARGSNHFYRWFLSTRLYRNHLEGFSENREMTANTKIYILGFASLMLTGAFLMTNSVHLRIFLAVLFVFKYYYFIFKIKTKKEQIE